MEQITQDTWVGGYSDNEFIGARGSFRASSAIDIRRNSKSIRLANKTVPEYSFNEKILTATTLKDSCYTFAFGENGGIYKRDYNGTWTAVHTLNYNVVTKEYIFEYSLLSSNAVSKTYDFKYNVSGSSEVFDPYAIVSSIEYNDYLVFCTAKYLHIIKTEYAVNDEWDKLELNYVEFSNGNSKYHPLIELYNDLFIGDGFTLTRLDSYFIFYRTDEDGQCVSIFRDEEIRFLTVNGSYLRIYAGKRGCIKSGRLYLWDTIQDAYNQFIDWSSLDIQLVIGKDNSDYVIANNGLYQASGYDRVRMHNLSDEDVTFEVNAIELYNDIICFGATSGISAGVWTYGSRTKEYPQSLNREYPTSRNESNDQITCLHNTGTDFLIFWKNVNQYKVDKIDTTLFQKEGYVDSLIFTGSTPAMKKHFFRDYLSFKPLMYGDKIEVYYSFDYSLNWELVYSVEYVESGVRNEHIKPISSDFNVVSVRIKLFSNATNTSSPEVIQHDLLYELDV